MASQRQKSARAVSRSGILPAGPRCMADKERREASRGFGTERRIAAFGSAAARLMRAYATQVEVLRRLRNGGQQFVRVEHVHVNDGGQAVIGNVKKSDA